MGTVWDGAKGEALSIERVCCRLMGCVRCGVCDSEGGIWPDICICRADEVGGEPEVAAGMV
jgi:hypothetical protein